MKPSFFSGNRWQIILHAIAWSLIVAIPIFIMYTYGDGNPRSLGHFYTGVIIYGIIFYVNYFFLIPRLYFKDKRALYLISAVLFIALMYLISDEVGSWVFDKLKQREVTDSLKNLSERNHEPRPPFRQIWMINFLFTSVLISGFSFGLRVMNKLAENEKQRKELEKEKLNSELAFLKNQISPHFFFNTLNNIYALIGMDSEAAQQSVLKLSKLMRYLLYESEQGSTLLSHEIDFMKNYIDLMKLRLNSRVDLKVTFPEEQTDLEFPPLLFIPFIENAFKHGITLRENSYIHIDMQMSGNTLQFATVNSIGGSSRPGDGQYSGIGLENVRKRLNLLFPDRHFLQIEQTKSEFIVKLEIKNISSQP
jgi:two-component system, LytTR family, sensor kinase